MPKEMPNAGTRQTTGSPDDQGEAEGLEPLAMKNMTPVHNPGAQELHREAWWLRVLDDDLTEAERLRWTAHLQGCARCREEWAALSRADAFLLDAPAPPALSPGFTASTVQAIVQRRRRRRYLGFLAALLMIAVVAMPLSGFLESALISIGQGLGAIVSARQVLLQSLVQTFLVLIVRWRAILPFMLGASVAAYVVMMPNGLLMTFALVWLSGHHQAQGSTGA